MTGSPGARGVFGNCQTPLLVLPNIYLFARGAVDPGYLDRPDDKVLADLARFLGGPPELLVPAWSCLYLGLDKLPSDLPAKLRAAKGFRISKRSIRPAEDVVCEECDRSAACVAVGRPGNRQARHSHRTGGEGPRSEAVEAITCRKPSR